MINTPGVKRRTWWGRVVYDRPKHGFRIRDLMRISKKFDHEIFQLPIEAFNRVLRETREWKTYDEGVWIGFGEGEFGGGGATREWFELPEDFWEKQIGLYYSGRVILIVELGW